MHLTSEQTAWGTIKRSSLSSSAKEHLCGRAIVGRRSVAAMLLFNARPFPEQGFHELRQRTPDSHLMNVPIRVPLFAIHFNGFRMNLAKFRFVFQKFLTPL